MTTNLSMTILGNTPLFEVFKNKVKIELKNGERMIMIYINES